MLSLTCFTNHLLMTRKCINPGKRFENAREVTLIQFNAHLMGIKPTIDIASK